MEKIRELRTRFTKMANRKVEIERQAFLDDLASEAFEDPYQFSSIDEAIAYLSRKYKLSADELIYIKKKANLNKIGFVERFRK